MYLDFHGHSIKKNIFMYGPEFPIYSEKYLKSRLLARLMQDRTEIFRYWSGLWRVSEEKRQTARHVLSTEYGIIHCFTVECSNGLFYLQSKHENREFTVQDFRNLGCELGRAMQDLLRLEIIDEKHKQQYRFNRFKKKSKLQDILQDIKLQEEQRKYQYEDEEQDFGS